MHCTLWVAAVAVVAAAVGVLVFLVRRAPREPDGTLAAADGTAALADAAHERRREIREWWTLGISILTLLAVVMYTCLSYRQLTLLVASTDAAKTGADAATNAAKTAGDALQFSREQHRQQQRAWVVATIEGSGYTFATGKTTLVEVVLRNSAMTPGLQVTMRSAVRELPGKPDSVPTDLFTRWPPDTNNAPMIVAPGSTGVLGLQIRPTTPETAPNILQSRVALVIYGELTYTDQYGTKGKSRFCRVYSPGFSNFHFCDQVADSAE